MPPSRTSKRQKIKRENNGTSSSGGKSDPKIKRELSASPTLNGANPNAREWYRNLQPWAFQIRELKGDQPFFNDWSSWVVDDDSQTLYLYGGCRPRDETFMATNDFYALKVSGKGKSKWRDMHDTLRYRNFDPLMPVNQGDVAPRPFPKLRHPAMTLCTICNRKCIIFFGGYSAEYMRVVSDLIIVDIASSIWWVASIDGGSVSNRMDSAIAFMDSKLFVFGGRQAFDDDSIVKSYSVAEHTNGGWKWIKVNAEYECPQLGYGPVAVTFSERKEILLISGRKKFAAPFHVNKKNMFTFNVESHTFRPSGIAGPVPGQLWWYTAYQLRARDKSQGSPSPSSREDSPLTDIDSPSPPSSPPALKDSHLPLIIGGWTSRDTKELIPELWQYDPQNPSVGMHCINVRERLAGLKLDIQAFIACRSRVFILGYKHPEKRRPAPKADYPPKDAKWNVSVEIVFA